jgi:hypothetical protein
MRHSWVSGSPTETWPNGEQRQKKNDLQHRMLGESPCDCCRCARPYRPLCCGSGVGVCAEAEQRCRETGCECEDSGPEKRLQNSTPPRVEC